jgi:hypothetical protein
MLPSGRRLLAKDDVVKGLSCSCEGVAMVRVR